MDVLILYSFELSRWGWVFITHAGDGYLSLKYVGGFIYMDHM